MSVSIRLVWPFARATHRHGGDAEAILRSEGIGREAFGDPATRVPWPATLGMLKASVEQSGQPRAIKP